LIVSGEIVLPALWEKVVEPGMEVSMHMWPMPEPPLPPPPPRSGPPRGYQRGQRRREYGRGNLGPGPLPYSPPPPPPTHRRHRPPTFLPPPLPPFNHHDSSSEGSSEAESLGAAEGQRFHRQKRLQEFPRMANEIATEGGGRTASEHSTRAESMPCSVCGKAENTRRCVRCKAVAYCGEEHQKADWKTHKKGCATKEKRR
jgi:MYND finger/Ubiquitin-like domain